MGLVCFVTESARLEKTSEIMEFNLWPNTIQTTKCHIQSSLKHLPGLAIPMYELSSHPFVKNFLLMSNLIVSLLFC